METPLLTREPGSGTRVRLDDELVRLAGRPITSLQELGSNAAVRVAVQSGAGPAELSRLSVADALPLGTLLEVGLDLELGRELRAVWTGPRHLSGLAGDLVRIARAWLRIDSNLEQFTTSSDGAHRVTQRRFHAHTRRT